MNDIKDMRQRKFWIGFTIVLCIVAGIVGYPAFDTKFGFPASVLWALAVICGIWVTYFIRSYLFSGDVKRNSGRKPNRSNQ